MQRAIGGSINEYLVVLAFNKTIIINFFYVNPLVTICSCSLLVKANVTSKATVFFQLEISIIDQSYCNTNSIV